MLNILMISADSLFTILFFFLSTSRGVDPRPGKATIFIKVDYFTSSYPCFVRVDIKESFTNLNIGILEIRGRGYRT